jgi:hypothetical protein
MTIMKNSKILAAVMLCTLSFGAFAAALPQPGNRPYQVGIAKATDVEAGSNIAPGHNHRALYE